MEKQKETKKTDLVKAKTWSVIVGGALLIGSGVVMIFGDTINIMLWLYVLIGFAVFGGGLFEFLGLRKPFKDERIARIGTRAATYSWYSTLLFVCTIAMISGFGGGDKVSMPQAVGTTIIVMVVSILVFNWYLGRTGDIE